MRIGDYDFRYICDIEPIRGLDGAVQELMPQSRYRNANTAILSRYGQGPFCKFKIPRISSSGVYILCLGEEAKYVGESVNLEKRFNMGYGNISPKNCYKGGQDTNCRINNIIYEAVCRRERVSLWFFETTDFKKMETAMRSTLRLGWNRV